MHDPALKAAYRATEYRIFAEPRFSLAIDRPEPLLAKLLAQAGAAHAAYLTACNPGSRRLPNTANAARTQSLRAELEAAGCRVLEGAAVDPAGRWPDEPSFLALGIAPAAARRLAGRYGQNALLLIGVDAVARLDWLI